MTAPDRIYINKVHGQHPEDWNFTDGKYLTKKQLAAKVEYIRADLAALAPTDAAQAREAAMQELIDAYEDIIDYGQLVLAKKDQWRRVEAAKGKLKEART